jgi:GNAT superfamily N-acetyltransferase
VRVATSNDGRFAGAISDLINSMTDRFDIARRATEWVLQTINAAHALLAVQGDEVLAFGCFEPMSEGGNEIVSVGYSAIAVRSDHHGNGIGKEIISALIEEGRRRYPNATHFTLTTNAALASIFEKQKFNKLPLESIPATKEFWNDCRGCRSFELVNNPESPLGHPTPCGHRCCCTGLVYSSERNVARKDVAPEL